VASSHPNLLEKTKVFPQEKRKDWVRAATWLPFN